MTWLQVKDDCKTAEEVKRRVMEGHRRRLAGMESIDSKPILPPKPPEKKRKAKPAFQSAPPVQLPNVIIKHGRMHEILRQTSRYFNVDMRGILSENRSYRFVRPRHVAFYLCRKLTRCSYHQIASKFNRCDHTTIISGVRAIESIIRLQKEPATIEAISRIEIMLDGSIADEPRSAQGPREKYTSEQVEKLKQMRSSGAPVREIALALGKSLQGIRSKIIRMLAETQK
jgi:hypothetical protein